jgi:hypothetical protein
MGTPAALNLLVIMLQRDVDVRVRRSAALALGTARDPNVTDALAYTASADPDPVVRANATAARERVLPFGRRPKLAAGLSVLCPGCGYFYLRQPERAGIYLGAAAALLAGGLVAIRETPIDPATGSRSDGRGMPLIGALQNLWFYGIYATYRDARLARGDEGAHFPVAREELTDLLAAPFNPHVISKPWVFAGVPVLLGGAFGLGYLISRAEGNRLAPSMRPFGAPASIAFFGHDFPDGAGAALGTVYNVSLFAPVAAGEESLFRGTVQAGLSETSLGLWGGWAVGSAIFGAAHILNFAGDPNGGRTAALAVPYITLTGSYLGFLYIHTNFSLLAGTAVHFWYDFLLSTFDFIADPHNQPFTMRVGFPF